MSEPTEQQWIRRRDLEGGKELGIWLLIDEDGTVVKELYVESHRYRGEDYDVYRYTPEGGWEHLGSHQTVEEAFAQALTIIDRSPYETQSRS